MATDDVILLPSTRRVPWGIRRVSLGMSPGKALAMWGGVYLALSFLMGAIVSEYHEVLAVNAEALFWERYELPVSCVVQMCEIVDEEMHNLPKYIILECMAITAPLNLTVHFEATIDKPIYRDRRLHGRYHDGANHLCAQEKADPSQAIVMDHAPDTPIHRPYPEGYISALDTAFKVSVFVCFMIAWVLVILTFNWLATRQTTAAAGHGVNEIFSSTNNIGIKRTD